MLRKRASILPHPMGTILECSVSIHEGVPGMWCKPWDSSYTYPLSSKRERNMCGPTLRRGTTVVLERARSSTKHNALVGIVCARESFAIPVSLSVVLKTRLNWLTCGFAAISMSLRFEPRWYSKVQSRLWVVSAGDLYIAKPARLRKKMGVGSMVCP